jgi:Arc/MetJ family transcription regulator
MTKRLVDIDDNLLEQARELTDARTMKEAINTALQNLVDMELRRHHGERLRTGESLDLDDEDVMAGAWRQP